jgi:hypothetical protein
MIINDIHYVDKLLSLFSTEAVSIDNALPPVIAPSKSATSKKQNLSGAKKRKQARLRKLQSPSSTSTSKPSFLEKKEAAIKLRNEKRAQRKLERKLLKKQLLSKSS